MPLPGEIVVCARSPRPDYSVLPDVHCPELPEGEEVTSALATLRALFIHAGLDQDRLGRGDWSPLSELIPQGARVVIKPNWVRHYNGSGAGLECLVTHATVVAAILRYVTLARPARVVVGDAPVQGCDFARLLEETGVDALLRRSAAPGVPVSVKDFRRTILLEDALGGARREDCSPLEDFVLFDLGADSRLEGITRP